MAAFPVTSHGALSDLWGLFSGTEQGAEEGQKMLPRPGSALTQLLPRPLRITQADSALTLASAPHACLQRCSGLENMSPASTVNPEVSP